MSTGFEFQRLTYDALSKDAFYQCLHFRQSILVVEQESAFPDIDGKDPLYHHLMVSNDRGELVGYCRVTAAPLAGAASFGRLSVRRDCRNQGIAGRLVKMALAEIGESQATAPIKIDAQAHLADFYRQFGFEPVGDLYDDVGVLHIKMVRGPLSAMVGNDRE